MEKNVAVIPVERIERLIFLIRGQRVMLDRHLAVLYGVSTKVLNQAVKRNKGRFPEDFMFQLTTQEARVWWADVMAPRLRSQNVTKAWPTHQVRSVCVHGAWNIDAVFSSK